MFTKMMVVVDGDVNIHNSEEVARYISENFDPANDVMFTQGPVDVLDHSCSVMAFGGKIGIDGTRKLAEERAAVGSGGRQLEGEKVGRGESEKVGGGDGEKGRNGEGEKISHLTSHISNLFPEIHQINATLLSKGISLIFIAVEKKKKEPHS